MNTSHWRTHAEKVIRDVLKANPDATLKELRTLLREAYPFGPRAMHPYKIWCSEVRAQLAEKFGKPKQSLDVSKLPLWLSVKQ